MMRVLIVEDETAAAENLEYLLRKAVPDIEVAANTESVEQTARWLSENTVDLIFMEIYTFPTVRHSVCLTVLM